MNGHAWFYLHGLHLPVRYVEQAKNYKLKYLSPTGIELAILGYLAGPLVRLTIGTVDNLCFKLLQYSEVTAIEWSVSHLTLNF